MSARQAASELVLSLVLAALAPVWSKAVSPPGRAKDAAGVLRNWREALDAGIEANNDPAAVAEAREHLDKIFSDAISIELPRPWE